MTCPMKESCQAKDWYPLFQEVYHERTWEEWQCEFCNEDTNQYLICYFYKAKLFFFNPSKRYFQSEKTKKAIRILEGKE